MNTETVPVNNQVGTAETVDVLAALFTLSERYLKAMENGSINKLEMLGFVFELGKVNDAVENIHLVPAELQDLTEEELTVLSADITKLLKQWNVSSRNQDITNIITRRLLGLVRKLQAFLKDASDLFEEIKALPPSAEVVA
jgi:hypothetical protein